MALLAGLAALGIIGVGAYAAGEAVRGWFGGGGGGFGAGAGTEAGGHGTTRRGRFGHGGSLGGQDLGGGGSGLTKQNKENAIHAMQRLIDKGWTKEAAASAVGQILTERPDFYTGDHGRKDHGSEGLFQWRLDRLAAGKAWARSQGRDWNDLDTQIDYFAEGPDPGRGVNMEAWKRTRSIKEGNRFGQQFERYKGGLQQRRALDAEKLMKEYDDRHKTHVANPLAHIARPGLDFHKSIESIRSAKPSTPWQQSTNEIHEHRAVTNDVNIHVAGGFPVAKTERPLSRPRNADSIRNTTSYAA